MNMLDIIEKKKRNKELTEDEIRYFINGYVDDSIPDYQVSSLLMAIRLNGLTTDETSMLTQAMVESGDQIDLSFLNTIVVDKHSTGGVGDKVSLIVAPIIASLGIPFAKMSGRGLGHTGGTIDKLESIEGFDVELSLEQFEDQVKQHNIALVGQTGNLVPADKKIYALRDVTGTVDSIPLIASSIMSKKIASGANAIVLDIKVGNGAFMKTVEEAEELAKAMVGIGNKLNRTTVAILTNMNQPLGREVGNANEIQEVIRLLKDNEYSQDLYDISVEIAANMVLLGEKANSIEEAKSLVMETITNGTAYKKFEEFISLQGGNLASIEKNSNIQSIDVTSDVEGYITAIETQEVGHAAMLLGAGRATKADIIDHEVGVTVHMKLGDKVMIGDKLFTIHTKKDNNGEIISKLKNTVTVSDKKTDVMPNVIKIIS